jgi:hypothetical protein
VVAVAVQSAFRLEMHQNEVFLFFKNHFWHQHIKTIWKHKKKIHFKQKKKSKFFGTRPNTPYMNHESLFS